MRLIHFHFTDPPHTPSLTISLSSLSLRTLAIPAAHHCYVRAAHGVKSQFAWSLAIDDDMLRFLVGSWASDSDRFLVVVRPQGEPSPNSKLSIASSSVELQSGGELDDKISVSDESGAITVDGASFIEQVTREVAIGKALTEVDCLLRPHKQLTTLLITLLTNIKTHPTRLTALQSTTPLHTHLKIYLHDLMKFSSNPTALDRLEHDPAAAFHLSKVYFTPPQIEYLLDYAGGTGLTFKQVMEVRMAKKMEKVREGGGGDYYVCSSHDLASVVREVFGIGKGFEEGKGFKAAYEAFEKAWVKSQR
ncbi:hypothetical protein BDK51DRAFT_47274 [Blyttiomyces helicus]|uniref:Uncharacterized protein n=1 Tax=Blyttiomyces helicus TaxID=388810 RepID=A0A4P9WH81_9FUNG|nr:hypothetical protein BDK51DRAFT_47274 [Blyttiomyces helicus]|eukprot:RKO92084.1 hypothetical protein BDK51DRAFT_47274 [Blyttiomyces helicus]